MARKITKHNERTQTDYQKNQYEKEFTKLRAALDWAMTQHCMWRLPEDLYPGYQNAMSSLYDQYQAFSNARRDLRASEQASPPHPRTAHHPKEKQMARKKKTHRARRLKRQPEPPNWAVLLSLIFIVCWFMSEDSTQVPSSKSKEKRTK